MQSALLLLTMLLRASRALVTPAARRSRSSARYASAQPLGKRGVTDGSEGITLFGSEAIQNGARLICVHRMTSDLPFYGAQTVAQPFWNACKRCGF